MDDHLSNSQIMHAMHGMKHVESDNARLLITCM